MNAMKTDRNLDSCGEEQIPEIEGAVVGMNVEAINLVRMEVVGLQYHNYALVARRLGIGDFLEFEREQGNKYDSKAIIVKYNGIKIGYMPKEANESFARMLDAGVGLFGVVVEHNVSNSIYKGCNRLMMAVYMNYTFMRVVDQEVKQGELVYFSDGTVDYL